MEAALKACWNERKALVEQTLKQELYREAPLDAKLAESMEYSLMAGGKRLRPILVMAAADAVGADGAQLATGEIGDGL